MSLEQFVIENISHVAFAAGLDSSDEDTKNQVKLLMESGIEDMISNGVSEQIITTKKLAVITLVQYVIDNMTSTPGGFVSSKVFQANVQKLKYLPLPESQT